MSDDIETKIAVNSGDELTLVKDQAAYWKGVAERALAKQHDYEAALKLANEEFAKTSVAYDALAKAIKPFADLGVGSGPDHETETYRIERGAIRQARAAYDLSCVR